MSTSERPAPRTAAWLQLARRLVLLLIAFGIALALIAVLGEQLTAGLEGTTSLSSGGPVRELVAERLPASLQLLGATLFLAAVLALVAVLVAVGVHLLEAQAGPVGSVAKALGRVWVFGTGTLPVVALALLLLYLFAIRLDLFPAAGMFDLASGGGRLQHLVLPALALALLPATLTAQVVARMLTLARQGSGARLWLAGLFRGLGTLLGQTGGLVGASVVVEAIFAWPGVGRLAYNSALRRDYPVLVGALVAYAIIILVGRLGAELFRWLARLLHPPLVRPRPEPSPWRMTARRAWVALALVLLLAPLGLAIAGLAVDADAVMQSDLQARNAPPSTAHPWGADELGRDLKARTLRGSLTSLGVAALVSLVILLPAALGGSLAGFLASSRQLLGESLADLILLPADVLLYIPTLPGALALVLLLGPGGDPTRGGIWAVILACAAMILPRAVRLVHTLWPAAPDDGRGLVLGLAAPGILFLGGLWAALALSTALDFLGLGIQPPRPSLGGIMGQSFQFMVRAPNTVLRPALIVGLCSLAFYTAADALAGYFATKEGLARLDE